MDRRAYSVILESLEPGERLLWSGRPRGGLPKRFENTFLLLFTVIWTVMSCVGLIQAYKERGLFSGETVAAGFALVIGVVVLPIVMLSGLTSRRSLFYGISDRRVITVHGVVSRKTASFA